jgi:uncharacterized membrane protein (UPF0127 family)
MIEIPTTRIVIATPVGPAAVDAEVVSTRPMLEQGLMYRTYLPPDAGMLFLMDSEADHGFYMRNTYVPLDMIYIARDMTVAGVINNAVPFSERRRHVGRPSIYVLEVNGGWASQHYVMPGAQVRFS